ncbi:hypothetical protein CHH62_14035 [Niallia circulans]|nr:hypothetical protein CHH62_14035 [Niallia circulans]
MSFLAKENNLPPLSYIGEREVVNIVYAALLHQAIRKPLCFFMGIWVEPRVKTLVPFNRDECFFVPKNDKE